MAEYKLNYITQITHHSIGTTLHPESKLTTSAKKNITRGVIWGGGAGGSLEPQGFALHFFI